MSQQGVGFAYAKADDGTWWVSVTHQSGSMSVTYGINVDQADTVADQMAEAIKATAAEARRARSGLILPTDPAPLNGVRRH